MLGMVGLMDMKSCSHCGTDRGYAETVRMAGMDNFLQSVQPLYGSNDEAWSYYLVPTTTSDYVPLNCYYPIITYSDYVPLNCYYPIITYIILVCYSQPSDICGNSDTIYESHCIICTQTVIYYIAHESRIVNEMKCKRWSLSFTTAENTVSKLGYIVVNPWFLASCKSPRPSSGSLPKFTNRVSWPPVWWCLSTAAFSEVGRIEAGTDAVWLRRFDY